MLALRTEGWGPGGAADGRSACGRLRSRTRPQSPDHMTSLQWFAVERITDERKNDHGETTHSG